jgi:hypothetical protein
MVGSINHLANPQNEAVTEVLLFLYIIVEEQAHPQEPKQHNKEYNNAIQVKHNGWPVLVLSIGRSIRKDIVDGLYI